MAKSFKTARTLKLYLDECREYLDRLNEDLVALESGSTEEELLQRIGRDLHTLKGSSGMMEFMDIYHISHSAEDVLAKLKENLPAVDKGLVSEIFAKLDLVESQVKSIESGTYVPHTMEPEGGAEAPASEAPQAIAPPPPPPRAATVAQTTRVAAPLLKVEAPLGRMAPEEMPPPSVASAVKRFGPGRVSLFQVAPGEVMRSLDKVQTIIADIEAKYIVLDESNITQGFAITLADSVDYLYRSLVGMGEPRIASVLVHLTTLFGYVREGKIKISSDIIEVLFKGVSFIKQFIEEASAGRAPEVKDISDVLNKAIQKKVSVLREEKDFLSLTSAEEIFARFEVDPGLARHFETFEKFTVSRAMIDGKRVYDFEYGTRADNGAGMLQVAEELKVLADWGEFPAVIVLAEGEGGRVSGYRYHSVFATEENLEELIDKQPALRKTEGMKVRTIGVSQATQMTLDETPEKREAAVAEEPVEASPALKAAAAPIAAPAATGRVARLKQAVGSDAAKPTVRVDTEKLDTLVDLIAELLINYNKMEQEIASLKQAIGRASDITTSLARMTELDEQTDGVMALEDVVRTFGGIVQGGMERGDMGGLFASMQHFHDLRTIHGRLTELFDIGLEKDRLLKESSNDARTLKQDMDSLNLEFQNDAMNIGRVINDLQHETMELRMLPISTVFQKFRRRVRDMAKALNKDVEFEAEGEDTVLDKDLIEKIEEPMLHLIRNALDHGIETRDERVRIGKPAGGKIRAVAYQEGNAVVVEVKDDGRGINLDRIREKCIEKRLKSKDELDQLDERETLNLIFIPGFSTADKVSELSGRGVGMDVVRDAIMRLKGSVDITSPAGEGTTVKLKLPLTLAIIQAMIVKSAGQKFVIPMDPIESAEQLTQKEIRTVEGKQVFRYRDAYIVPLVRLTDVFNIVQEKTSDTFPVVVVQQGDKRTGIIVDEVTEKQQVVIKSLRGFLGDVRHISGATIFGDGSIALILDVASIVSAISHIAKRSEDRFSTAARRRMMNVLLVDDSLSGRMAQRDMLERMGFVVDMADSGAEALGKLIERSYDVVVTDIIMPRMDGYELTAHIRSTPRVRDIPVVMVTSDVKSADRKKAYESGANEFLTKPFSDMELRAAIEKHVRR